MNMNETIFLPQGSCGLKILGIESSCDETGAAVYDTQHGLLSNEL